MMFNIKETQLKNLYYINKEMFKQVVNWLYWNESLNVNDILRIFSWSQGVSTYGKINSALGKRREIHNYRKDTISYSTRCYLSGMRITDLFCTGTHKGKYEFNVRTSNYYGCEYFFSVLSGIKHTSVNPVIGGGEFSDRKVLYVAFLIRIPSKNFEFNIADKFEVLNWVSRQYIECVEKFFAACLDCDGSVYENCAYLWSKDIEMLKLLKKILKERFNITIEVKKKESENKDEETYYLYVNDRKLINRIMKRLKHPCKKLNKECEMTKGRDMAWKWLLENFPETPTLYSNLIKNRSIEATKFITNMK